MPLNLTSPSRHVRRSVANSSFSAVSGRHPSPGDGWEGVGLASTEYAHRRRELMQLISDLRSMGAQTLIDLPSIVVIGGQSAGKSSLVEAISGVNVPRDSGTCTRCPMECTMSSNTTSWSCKIKLRFDYDDSGKPVDKSREIDFGSTITNRNDVDIWIRRAQTAILNPSVSPESFYGKTTQELRTLTLTNSLKFSQNVVSILIKDPNATDLSFVDLPGLVQNEDGNVVDLVRRLTESYISRQNAIILTTIPMSDDMQNQQAVKLAREADPHGERTIGILTKPDTLGSGAVNARKNWVDVIEGHQYALKHGYYCVRLPDDAQRQQGITRSQLQCNEAEYFNGTAPWKDIANRGRFGIPAFVSDISTLLVNHINKVLPQLIRDVEQLLASCLQEIGTLPELLEVDPQVEVLVRVNAFCDDFKGIVSGTSSDKSLAQRNIALYNIFAQRIRGTSPDFRPFDQPEKYQRMDVLESEEGVAVDPKVKTMGVYEVRKAIRESTAWELPGNIPYEVKTRLISQFTELWFAPAEECLTSINDVLDDVTQKLVETHFGRFKVLRDLISALIYPDIELYKDKTRTAVKETLRLEISPAYTQNLDDYNNIRARWLAEYRYAYHHPGKYEINEHPAISARAVSPGRTARLPGQPSLDQALHYLAQAGYEGLTVTDLAVLSRGQRFDDELTVMADVRSFFTIACKRVIDHIPLKIEHSLHHPLVEGLSVSLLQRLMADTASSGNFSERMEGLVSEDPAIEKKRTRLQGMQTRLQEMRQKLFDFAT